jgi:hypothetical protein
VWAETWIHGLVPRWRHVVRENDVTAAPDAVAEGAQTVSRCRAVAREAAAFASSCRFAALVQRA